VALLFVIFDVEVAFFFPWAVVFGKTIALRNDELPPEQRAALTAELVPGYQPEPGRPGVSASTANDFAWIALIDIAIFFGVLLVGFAYLWRRGDIDWVRSVAAERSAAGTRVPPLSQPTLEAAGAKQW
jgi:NADH-quinone oxidoreductase subunit A